MREALYSVDPDGNTVRIKGNVIIANFNTRVVSVIECQSASGVIRKYLVDIFAPEFIRCVEIESAKLEKYDYSTVDPSLLLSPTISSAGREMAYAIKEQASAANISKVWLLDSLGWHNIDGQYCYLAGNKLIGNIPAEKYRISNELSGRYHFLISPNLSEEDCLVYAFLHIKIHPGISDILFTAGLSGVMRQLILDAGVPVKNAVNLKGITHSQKTSIVKLLTSLYDRDNLSNESGVCSVRVSSSLCKVEQMLNDLNNATLLLDDFRVVKQKKKHREQEDLVYDIIRDVGDNTSRMTARKQNHVNCQVIITSECPVTDETSDLGRILILNVQESLANDRMTGCQREPLALSGFYNYFLSWLCSEYSNIVNRLRSEFAAFRATESESQTKFKRLLEFQFLLNFVFDVFLTYAKGIVGNKADAFRDIFRNDIDTVVKQQLEYMATIETREALKGNLSAAILYMRETGVFIPGEKDSECYIKKNNLYVKSKYLAIALSVTFHGLYSRKTVIDYFRDAGFSSFYDDGTTLKDHKKRYLILNLAELREDALKNR